ncbi:MAG: glucosaminidase domain-containing protein [Bacteroidales bacterium]|nr:glucosaminidase domain-containing protein [Bacteroidales bacterium]
MRIFIGILLTIYLIVPQEGDSQTNHQKRLQYIDKYKKIAVEEMNQFGIPASITLAQGILESNSGASRLARKGNNHFGIKCHKDWEGKKIYKNDDRIAECFRKYADPAFSYRDHSLFLSKRNRYSRLFKYDITSYKKWAKGLSKTGYATDPHYASRLIEIIEKYNLHQFDIKYEKEPIAYRGAMEKAPVPSGENFDVVGHQQGRKLYENNGKKLVKAGKKDTYLKIGHELGIKKANLLRYNDLSFKRGLAEGELVYLEGKRWRSQKHKYHLVRKNESWRSIAQRYGVRLSWLRLFNMFKKELEPGMKLKLKPF